MSKTTVTEHSGIEQLLGKTFTKICCDDRRNNIIFITTDSEVWIMEHSQECCEEVYLESIVGDLQNLIGHVILKAEEKQSDNEEWGGKTDISDGYDLSIQKWTFYTLATIKGYVDIRWYGAIANGYYSEKATIYRLQ